MAQEILCWLLQSSSCVDLLTRLLSMLQMLRIQAMKEERERQYKAGERSKEERYAKAPRIDAY